MPIIENALSKWSVQAGLAFSAFWGVVSAYWLTLEPEVQASILADWGFEGLSMAKVLGYAGLIAAAAQGVTLALRVLKQKPADAEVK